MTDKPIYLDEARTLFGVATAPVSSAEKRAVGVVILNSGLIHNVGPFRLSVDIAHDLAACGFPVIRMDQTSKGESFLAERKKSDLETLSNDLALASASMNRHFGTEKIVLLGLCAGADNGLQGGEVCDHIAGLVMLDGWAPRTMKYFLHRFGPKIVRIDRWPMMLMRRLRPQQVRRTERSELAGLSETSGPRWDEEDSWRAITVYCKKNLPVLAVYTGDADDYYSYDGQFLAALKSRDLGSRAVDELFLPDRKHLYPLASHREDLVTRVSRWMCDRFPV